MPDAVFLGLPGPYGLLIALAAVAGGVAGWAAIALLLYPLRPSGVPGLMPVQGFLPRQHDLVADFAARQLLADLPSPRRFFEQLGPDRFRREFARALRERLDEHVDDVMTRRNEQSWSSLSVYARARVYAHVHRRLPYVVDDFVDHVQRDLDDIVHPVVLVRRHLHRHPEHLAQAFVASFGPGLRFVLPLAALAGALAVLPLPLLLHGQWLVVSVAVTAALAGSATVLFLLGRPRQRRGLWPFQVQGLAHRRQREFVRTLTARLAGDALGWQAITAEFLRGAHAGRVRHMMKREVAAILDVPVFRASMQLLLGPNGFAEVKASAVEKAVEMLSSVPLSAALREHYRFELERTLEHAVARIDADDWATLWQRILQPAWRQVPLLVAAASGLLAFLVSWLWLQLV